ncbi:F-box protein CPR1-like [Pistacia vera]|uniref:F-box protein CPR1-like n=1 Tax=Pistacia vera TaxID=55513 RepID=UPI001263AAF9|nr:F-box protein CPR1-like [Pistacia vera]
MEVLGQNSGSNHEEMSESDKYLIIELVNLRLPVKMLMRSKCVSPHLCRLINSQDFRRLYLHHNNTNSDNFHLFVSIRQPLGQKMINTLGSVDVSHNQALRDVYSKRFSRDYEIVGCCNGLICLYRDVEFRLVLWNAFTREYKILPEPRDCKIRGGHEHFSHGFGHDGVTNDYKVVKIFQSFKDGKMLVTDVNVYSLKSNLWTKVGDFPFGVSDFPKNGCFLNGALHWLASMNESTAKPMNESTAKPLVVRFKLGVEKFDLLQVPDVDSDDDLRLGVLGDCLSVCASNEDSSTAVIWVAKNREPWTWIKQHSVVFEASDKTNIRTLAYTDKGKKLLLTVGSKTLVWYGLRDEEDNKFSLPRHTIGFEAATCIESLESLGVDSRADV